jgi:hypothetical protein
MKQGKEQFECNLCESTFGSSSWITRHQQSNCLGTPRIDEPDPKRQKTVLQEYSATLDLEQLKTELQLLKIEAGLDNGKMNRIVHIVSQASRMDEIRRKELSMNYSTIESEVTAEMEVIETSLKTIQVPFLNFF